MKRSIVYLNMRNIKHYKMFIGNKYVMIVMEVFF